MRFTAQKRAGARSLAAGASAILLTGLGVTLAASPASASPANCSAEGYQGLCIYADLNYTGAPQVNYAYPNGNFCTAVTGAMDDKATSIYNPSNRPVKIFQHPNCTGYWYEIPAHAGVYDLRQIGNGTFTLNDQVSGFGI